MPSMLEWPNQSGANAFQGRSGILLDTNGQSIYSRGQGTVRAREGSCSAPRLALLCVDPFTPSLHREALRAKRIGMVVFPPFCSLTKQENGFVQVVLTHLSCFQSRLLSFLHSLFLIHFHYRFLRLLALSTVNGKRITL
jgi:hypothetical protein